MEENIKWDDSRDEIMDIIEMIDDNKEPQIPVKCPICNTGNAHIYICTAGKMAEVQSGHGAVIIKQR